MDRYICFLVVFVLFVNVTRDVEGRSHSHRSQSDSDGRIVGGYNTTIQDAPYQVYLLLLRGTRYYQCGGSIISNRSILTAAHCLTGVVRAYARVGSTQSNSGGTMYESSNLRSHPRYNAANSDYDVGVIRLSSRIAIDGTNTRVVSLAPANTMVEPGTVLKVTGWGTTSEGGETSENLMGVEVPVVSTSECRTAYGQNAITTRMLCAGVPEGGKDSCQGDSGGPAVDSNQVQVGIVSFGYGCARQGYPGVYTNVSEVRRWIRLAGGV